jgi:hypothetical protein
MAIFILLYLAFQEKSSGITIRLLFITGACYLTAFLFFLRSFTGIIILMFLAAVLFMTVARRSRIPWVRTGITIAITTCIAVAILYSASVYMRNFRAKPVDPSSLEAFTVNGNAYSHDLSTAALENGHYIDLYICEPELRKGWNSISKIRYDSFDHKGQSVSYTLRRYLTSKGLRKDSAALRQLNSQDIQYIENGLTNYRFIEKPDVFQRLYETLWEIHVLSQTGYVQRHSLGQRLAFLRISRNILKKNMWSGLGTGDVYDAMLKSAQADLIAIDPAWKGKPHNQFVFYLLSFGVPGFLVLLFCFIYPVYARKATRIFLFNIFIGITGLSMIALDTLESYDSVVFFSFFYSLFVFGVTAPEKNNA